MAIQGASANSIYDERHKAGVYLAVLIIFKLLFYHIHDALRYAVPLLKACGALWL